MARIIFQPWVNQDPTLDPLERMTKEFAILIGEAQRRVLQLPGGEEDLRSTGDFTDEMLDFYRKINEGAEPSRIKEIRLDKSERNLLKELGAGRPDDERNRLRLQHEIDFLMREAEEMTLAIKKEKERRDPGYSERRAQKIRDLIEAIAPTLDEFDEFAREAIEFSMFTPESIHGALVHHSTYDAPGEDGTIDVTPETAPYVLDLHHATWHAFAKESGSDDELFLTTRCGVKVRDLGVNRNTRILQMIHLGSMGDPEEGIICRECLPDLDVVPRITLGKYGIHVAPRESVDA